MAGLSLLLVVPVYAVSQLSPSVDWRILAGVPGAMSLFTFFAYRNDKNRAEAGEWRIPEPKATQGNPRHIKAEVFSEWSSFKPF